MRHFGSLILSLLLAPAIWALSGIGLAEYGIGLVEDGSARGLAGPEPRMRLLLGLAALVAAGALFSLLIMPRLSPVGPTLAGLAFLGMIGWATLDIGSLQRTLPRTFLGTDGALTAPARGCAALFAVPLLATAFSPRRWQRYNQVPALYATPGQLADPRQFDGLSQFDSLGRSEGPGRFNAPSQPDLPTQAGFTQPYGVGRPPGLSGQPTQTYPARPTSASPVFGPPGPQRLIPPPIPAPEDSPTTRISPPPAPTEAEATTDLVGRRPAEPASEPADEPAEHPDRDTQPGHGAPPPPTAYPPPGHSAPTAPPVDSDETRRL